MPQDLTITATANHLTSDPTNDRSPWQWIKTYHREAPPTSWNAAGDEVGAGSDQNERPVRPAARFAKRFQEPPLRQDAIVALQRWEGNVLTATKDSFVARVRDLTAAVGDEEIEVALDEISVADRELVVPGASFYWTIGYRDMRNGQRLRISEFRFRRVRTLSQSELTDATARARKLEELLGW